MVQGINRRRSGGQSLVEFALIIPLFLAILFGIIDIGRVIWASDSVANAAREGARYAAVRGGSSTLTPIATKEEIRNVSRAMAIAGGTITSVTVCYSSPQFIRGPGICTGDTDGTGVAPGRGSLVTVRVMATVPILTGSLLGMAGLPVSGSSTVLVNN